MPVVMVCTNPINVTAKLYVVMFIRIVKIVHYALLLHIQKASLNTPRDAFIIIYLFICGQQNFR